MQTLERTSEPLLDIRALHKSFPGVKALAGVNLTVRRGEIVALMGENGAGKSTLIKVLTGVYARDAGEMFLEGRPVDARSPKEAQAFGISTVYQEVNLIPQLSVAENILLGRQPKRWGILDWRRLRANAAAALQRLGISIDVRRPLNSYSIGIRQMVAIARALDVSAKLLILDEPTSSLDAHEVQQLFGVLRRLKARGLGILFVTHFLEQVYQISDRIAVFRNGQSVGEFETSALPRLQLIAKMMGKELAELQTLSNRSASSRAEKEPAFLHARRLGRTGAIAPVDLEVRAGETLGLAGLLGSGRTELARLLFGVDRADSGRLEIDGRAVRFKSPRDAIRRRFGFCPEDRKQEGIIPDFSVRENIVLALQATRGWFRPLRRARQAALANEYIRSLNIATPDAEKPLKLLSGGNQQKVLLARWLASEPRFLILDEPTRGIDVGAKLELEKVIGQLVGQGMAVLFISSEIEETTRNCHRVIVLRDREKITELRGDEISESAIMKAIAAER